MTSQVCPICEIRNLEYARSDDPGTHYRCPFCGEYLLTREVDSRMHRSGDQLDLNSVQRAALSCRIRRNITPNQMLRITMELIDEVRSEHTAYNPIMYVNDLVRHVGDHVSTNGTPITSLSGEDVQRVVCAPSEEIIIQMMKELFDDGLMNYSEVSSFNSPSYRDVTLTFRGWERYTAEKRGQIHSSYGFIAMRFFDNPKDDSFGLPAFVEQVVKPDAKDATGYDLYDIRHFQQSGIIDNYLRATIRDAAFVICDLTHDNHGAYWESGYADALDKPVIYICEKGKFDADKSHFDTNHCTTIIWEKDNNHNQFRQNLIATIRRSLDLFD